MFFIPAPGVDGAILPPNTVCCSYIKKQSINKLFNKVQEIMTEKDPGLGIFSISFNRELGEHGAYYSINFDWRERETEEEFEQLNLIAAFMSAYENQLIDLDGTRDLICVDGWSAQQLQDLIAQRQHIQQPEKPSLPAA